MNFQIVAILTFLTYASTSFAEEKIVVVGGGLAGLTAAYRLQQQGCDVELYEARERVGGRVLSAEINGHIAELGGQSLNDGGDALTIRGLIAEMGLEVIDDGLINSRFFSFAEGVLKKAPSFPREIDLEEVSELREKSRSMSELLDLLIEKDDPLYRIVGVRFAAFEGAFPENLAPIYLESLVRFLQPPQGDVYRLSSVVGGNGLLPLRLFAKLGERAHLGHQLTSVEKNNGSYQLTFANGKECEADIILLAMPCSVYDDIRFGEGVIPEEKLKAIRDVRYGTNAKVFIPAKPGGVQIPLLMNQRAIGWFEPRRELFALYYTGEASRFTKETLEETYWGELPMVRGAFSDSLPDQICCARDEAFAAYNGAVVGYSWPSDPYAKGSYSYIAPGQEALLKTLSEVKGEWVKELFAPIDETLYFAGEHASILLDVPGTMEAACESGERAARMIRNRLD